MDVNDVNDFDEEKQCFFKDEKYSVRDNGAIYRHPSDSKKPRKNDNFWTFGKESKSNPYLHHSGVRVHRIVATAFHGEQPNEYQNIVDHIDTNCKNNRPDNLRWVSRIENALSNPITRKKIEDLCGSIEAFLDDPSMLRELSIDRNIDWMREVDKEEAANSKQRMSIWANQKSSSKGSNKKNNYFNKTVYKPLHKWEAGLAGEPGLEFANTPGCATYFWHSAYFPLCPKEYYESNISGYFENLSLGAVFSYTEPWEGCSDQINHIIVDRKIDQMNEKIFVLTKLKDDKWCVIGIEQNEKAHFIHYNLACFESLAKAKTKFYEVNETTNLGMEGYGHK